MKNIKCPNCGKITSITELQPEMELECHLCSGTLVKIPGEVPREEICPVCGKRIAETSTCLFCPDCGVEYHADCWQANEGCSTPDCSYRGALSPMDIPLVPEPKKEPPVRPEPKVAVQVEVLEEKEMPKESPKVEWNSETLPAMLKYYAIGAAGGMMTAVVVFFSIALVGWILYTLLGNILEMGKILFYITLLLGAAGGVFLVHKKMPDLMD